jgi:hypothetical protein
MSAEDQKNLFREGVQFNVNQLQHGGGSGLGLWISKGTYCILYTVYYILYTVYFESLDVLWYVGVYVVCGM